MASLENVAKNRVYDSVVCGTVGKLCQKTFMILCFVALLVKFANNNIYDCRYCGAVYEGQ